MTTKATSAATYVTHAGQQQVNLDDGGWTLTPISSSPGAYWLRFWIQTDGAKRNGAELPPGRLCCAVKAWHKSDLRRLMRSCMELEVQIADHEAQVTPEETEYMLSLIPLIRAALVVTRRQHRAREVLLKGLRLLQPASAQKLAEQRADLNEKYAKLSKALPHAELHRMRQHQRHSGVQAGSREHALAAGGDNIDDCEGLVVEREGLLAVPRTTGLGQIIFDTVGRFVIRPLGGETAKP